MEEDKILKRGARAHTWSKVFIVIQILAVIGMTFNLLEAKQPWLRFSDNASMMLATLARFDIEPLLVFVAFLIGSNFVSIGALILALLAWLRYKNEDARPMVTVAVGVIVATSLIALGSQNIFY